VSLYLDTSALLPYYRQEAHSEAVQRFLSRQREPLAISALSRVELASTLARWVRTGELDERGANRVESAFQEDLAARRFRIRALDAETYDRASRWLLARRTSLRTLDALHLACAESAGAALVTLDVAFAQAANQLGVATVRID